MEAGIGRPDGAVASVRAGLDSVAGRMVWRRGGLDRLDRREGREADGDETTLAAALASSACKQDAPGDAASGGGEPQDKGFLGGEPAQAPPSPSSGLPEPDMKKPLESYPELQSGQQIMFLYVAASKLPPDFAKLAEAYSSEYRNTYDTFRKNDLLTAIKPQLEQKIKEAAASPYAWMQVNHMLSVLICRQKEQQLSKMTFMEILRFRIMSWRI